jgi:hypothetical protein
MNRQQSKGMRRVIVGSLVSMTLFATTLSANHGHGGIDPLTAFVVFSGLYHHNHYHNQHRYYGHGGYKYRYSSRHGGRYNNRARHGQHNHSRGGYGYSRPKSRHHKKP